MGKATHRETCIEWYPVLAPEIIHIDGQPVVLHPGKDVKIVDANNRVWRNDPQVFVERYKLDMENKAEFKIYYPDVEIPE